jgi:hypothetical protein
MRDRVTVHNLVLRCLAIAIGIVVGAGCVVVLDRWVPPPPRFQFAVRSAAQAVDEVHLFGPGDTSQRCTAQLTEWLSSRLFWPQPIAGSGSNADRSFHPSSAETASTIR